MPPERKILRGAIWVDGGDYWRFISDLSQIHLKSGSGCDRAEGNPSLLSKDDRTMPACKTPVESPTKRSVLDIVEQKNSLFFLPPSAWQQKKISLRKQSSRRHGPLVSARSLSVWGLLCDPPRLEWAHVTRMGQSVTRAHKYSLTPVNVRETGVL